MHSKRSHGFLVLLLVPVVIFLFVTVSLIVVHRVRGVSFSYEHNGTDLTFASSDGGWRGEEDMLSGRDFTAVLVDFELYRIRSHQPEVRLLRTKPWKKPWKWAWWFDRRKSQKWKVPYAPLDTLPAGRAGTPTLQAFDPTDLPRAQREAEAFFKNLR
jgi:hypothetical protein